MRNYNELASQEVAAIVSGSKEGDISGRDIILQRGAALLSTTNKSLYKISIFHRPRDPLSYVLIFPYNEDVCHYRIPPCPAETNEQEKRSTRCSNVAPHIQTVSKS